MRIDKLVNATLAALEDVKARDIVVLDVKKMTSLFDRVIIASADSSRQSKALSSNLQKKLKALGATIHGVEGEQGGEWILVDLGAVIVHIMQPATRQYYNLEELWTPAGRSTRRRAGSARSAA